MEAIRTQPAYLGDVSAKIQNTRISDILVASESTNCLYFSCLSRNLLDNGVLSRVSRDLSNRASETECGPIPVLVWAQWNHEPLSEKQYPARSSILI